MAENYNQIPTRWFRKYLKNDEAFGLFLQNMARAFEQSQTKTDPITEVIKYHKRNDRDAKVYYVEKSKILSLYTLLQEVDINAGNLIATAEERLGTSNIIKVAPQWEYNFYGDDDGKPKEAYFVSKHSLVENCDSLSGSLIGAMASRNYVIATSLLAKAIAAKEECSEYGVNLLVEEAYRSNDLEIWKGVCDLVGRARMLKGTDVLYIIACNNSHNILRYLAETYPVRIGLFANPNGSDESPIFAAARRGAIEVAEILLEHTKLKVILRLGCNNTSLLTEAASSERNGMIDMLVTKPCIKDLIGRIGSSGYTALHYAAKVLEYQTFKRLYDVYADSPYLLARSTLGEYTVFHTMLRTGDEARVAQFMNDMGSNCPLLYMVNDYGLTPLHQAASAGMGEVVNALYGIYAERGLLLEKTKENGYTFMIHLIQGKHTSIIRSLIERTDFYPQLALEVDSHGQTPMSWADDSVEICELLMSKVTMDE